MANAKVNITGVSMLSRNTYQVVLNQGSQTDTETSPRGEERRL